MIAQSNTGEQVYATLLLTDAYTAGMPTPSLQTPQSIIRALVLGRSLRDAGTCKKLAVLVTLDSVSQDAIAKLKTVYDHVIPVSRIQNDSPDNLHLMARSDLHSAFTKIQLWKLTQFSRIVYIDADVVAYRAPDELFNIPHIFCAAPDIGWPDIFNSGVMVLTPSIGDFRALAAMTERGISFDGADQGLLNQYFGGNYHRLSFTYNVTPSAHYQYLPAYRHFQSSIKMVHFIGKNKPWFAGRQASFGSSAYDEMVGRWWAVYDRHYYGQDACTIAQSTDATWAASTPGFKPLGFTSAAGSSPAPQLAPAPIFPWERNQPKPTRKFYGQPAPSARAPAGGPRPTAEEPRAGEAPRTPALQPQREKEPREPQSPMIAPSVSELGTVDNQSEAVTPTTPTRSSQSNPWTSYPRLNAWDDVPGINRYVEGFERLHKLSLKPLKGGPAGSDADPQDEGQTRGTRVTDFPTETERPSLPVTPAPVRRSAPWSQDEDSEAGATAPSLPVAEGVPDQSDWDPTEQLQKLAAQQSEVLLRKLGAPQERSLENLDVSAHPPIGTEDILSAASVDQAAVSQLLSPRPVKAVMTSRLERKMQKGDDYSGPTVTWDEDEVAELSRLERDVLDS